MKHLKERRAGRLFPFKVYGKWWASAGLLLSVYFLLEDASLFQKSVHSSGNPAATLTLEAQPQSISGDRQIASVPSPRPLAPHEKAEIESLFSEIQKNPENREELLLTLKRVLQQTFEGQEDCWSCEGTEYFDRFDQIAGSGEARKPLGFREWIELGDEAFAKSQSEDARRFYSQALQVIDERAWDVEDSVDTQFIEKVRERCAQLGCR